MNKQEILAALHESILKYVKDEKLRAPMEKFLTQTLHVESGGSLTEKSTESTATGLFQFTKTTWKAYGKGASIFDGKAQCDAAVHYALDNRATLKQAFGKDFEPTAGQYYLSHFADGTKAVEILQADADTPIQELLSSRAIHANRVIHFHGKDFASFNAGDLRQWAAACMDLDIDARVAYQVKHKQHKTTKIEDDVEAKERYRILNEFGVKKEVADTLSKDSGGILGEFILKLLQFFGIESEPAVVRDAKDKKTLEEDKKIIPAEFFSPTQLPGKIRSSTITSRPVGH